MPPNAYIQDGHLYWSDGQEILGAPKRVKTTKKIIEDLEDKVAILEAKIDNLEEKYNMILNSCIGVQKEKEHDSLGVLVKK